MAKGKKSNSRMRSEVNSINKKKASSKKGKAGSKGKGTATSKKGDVLSEFNKALLKEIKKTNARKRQKRRKDREQQFILRVLQSESGVRLIGAKKPKGNSILPRRNSISKKLKRYLELKRLDLLTYSITDTLTGEIVFEAAGERKTGLPRFNLVLKNIVSNTLELDTNTIDQSFDGVFKEYSGIKSSNKVNFAESFFFFDYKDVFLRPIYNDVIIKLTVAIPFVSQDGVYDGKDDPKLFTEKGEQNNSHLFTASELMDWFPGSNAWKYCREWDRANHSPVVEFSLEDREGDGFVHYHLSVFDDFFDRYEEKKKDKIKSPHVESVSKDEREKAITERIDSLKAALPYLTGAELDAVSKQIEDDQINLQLLKREQKQPGSGEAERSKIEAEQKEKERAHELELAKIKEEQSKREYELEKERLKLKEVRLRMMNDMIQRGFSYAEIKDLLGED